MSLVSGIVVFSVIWWIVLFMALPIGVKVDSQPQKGFATSAPLQANVGKKMLITTLITIVLWFVADFLITHNVLEIP